MVKKTIKKKDIKKKTTKKVVNKINNPIVIKKPIIKIDSKQLSFFKQFDNSLIEEDIEQIKGKEFFCAKLNKGISFR